MGLENVEVVDAVGIEPASDCLVLSIIDSWDWSDEDGHLLALQKLNSCFGFVESGQLREAYCAAEGKSLRIDLISRCPLPASAVAFLNNAKGGSRETGCFLAMECAPCRYYGLVPQRVQSGQHQTFTAALCIV